MVWFDPRNNNGAAEFVDAVTPCNGGTAGFFKCRRHHTVRPKQGVRHGYPFGILADHLDRRLQLGLGTIILIGADVVLANASTIWLTALGAAL